VVSGGSEAGSRRQPDEKDVGLSLRQELTRKGLHLLSAVVPMAYAAGLTKSLVIGGLGVALATAAAVELGRVRSARARTVFDASVGVLLRTHEWRRLSGATWLIIALLVAAACFPRDVAIAAMCAVSLGDAAAAVVGRTLTRSGPVQRKSFAGSTACFAASAIAARTLAAFAWREALVVGVLAAAAERPRRPLDDNLRISIAVGCGILLWRMGFS
jgi:dolichol kinase